MTNRFAVRSLGVVLSKTAPLLAQMIVILYYSRVLSLPDYGQYQSLWLFTNVLSTLALFGLPALLLSHDTNGIFNWTKDNKSKTIFFALATTLIPFLIFIVQQDSFSFSERIHILLLVLIQNAAIITETLSIKNEKEKKVLAVNAVVAILFLMLHIGLVYYNEYSLLSILIGLISLQLIKFLLLLPSAKRNQTNSIKTENNTTASQWFYLGLNDVLNLLFKWLDKWIILILLTGSEFAVYFNGAYEIPVFGLMLSAVGNILLVDLAKKENNNKERFQQINYSATILLGSIVLPCFLFFLLFHAEFFTVLFSAKYTASIPFFLITIFLLPVRCIYPTAALQVNNKSQIILRGAILDVLIAVILMFALYPVFKAKGIAAAFVISTYVQALYYVWQTSKLYNIGVMKIIPFKQLLFITVSSAVCIGIAKWSSAYLGLNNWASVITGVLTLAVVIGVILGMIFRKVIKEL